MMRILLKCSKPKSSVRINSQNSDLYLAGYAEYGWYKLSPGFMRIDTNGNKLWSSTFDFPDSYHLMTHTLVKQSEDSYYSFCFNPFFDIITESNNVKQEPANDCWLLKLNGDGDTVFSKHYEEIGWVNDLILDNDYLITVGSTNYFEEDSLLPYFTKSTVLAIDTNGTFIWRKEFLSDQDSRINSIIKNEQGNYVITGTIALDFDHFGYLNNPDKMFLFEIDMSGNLLFEYFSDIEYSDGRKIIISDNGNYAICGDGLNPNNSSQDVILWKFDNNFNLLLSNFSGLPGADESFSFKQTPDGGFIFCGDYHPPGTSWSQTFFYLKTDYNGNEEWHRNNEMSSNHAHDVLVNDPLGYYVAGYGLNHAQLVKTDLEGNGLILPIGNETLFPYTNIFKVSPNPGNYEITIESLLPENEYSFSLFDLFGNKTIEIDGKSTKLKVNTSILQPGLYFYQITNESGYRQTGKWIKE